MNKLVEQEETTAEGYAVENESADKVPSTSEEIIPFRKPVDQYLGSTAGGASPARSRKGGGPRTSRGKAKSRRNALTHGIFAKVMLLDEESRAEYEALLSGYRDYFQPVGTVEDVHVEELAALKWRERRLLQAERAEIQGEKKFNSRAFEREQQERGEAAIHEISTTGEKYGLVERRQNPLVLGRAVDLLESLEASIEVRSFDPKNDRQIIDVVFGEKRRCQLRALYELCLDPARGSGVPELKEFDVPPDARKAKFLGYLVDEINDLKRYQKKVKGLSEERKRLESQSSGVPEPARLDRLLKYDASLQRDYDRSLNQLERLQRARKGQPALPTLNVNVSA